MKNLSRIHIMLVAIMISFLFSCGTEEPINNEDPSDLKLEVNVSTDRSGKVNVEATALNAVFYTLYIDSDEDLIAESTTGSFVYTFLRSGLYQISVRAYGTSGKFVRETVQTEVIVENEVLLNDGYITPLFYEGYDLVWNDEFEGTGVKAENWSFEIGDGCPNCGWGNNELQYYRKENAKVANGVISIEAKKEKYQGKDYTSSRMVTKNLRSFQYGRIDIRALLPKGQGIWPALWMLGSNFESVSWPECGEIDIMEMIGGTGNDNTTHGTLHWGVDGSHAYTGGSYSIQSGILADEYHVFSIEWNESSISWLLNDLKFHTLDITPANMSEFHKEFFFIMNIAVGGNWPGNPDISTVFPQKMNVDYLRVFQKQN